MNYDELCGMIRNKNLILYITNPRLALNNEGPIRVTEIKFQENPITKSPYISLTFPPQQVMAVLPAYSGITIDSSHIRHITNTENEITISYKDGEEFRVEISN